MQNMAILVSIIIWCSKNTNFKHHDQIFEEYR
nr:MAG TPA: hypothetical protein [Caudoviricetes sp.]